MPHFQGHSTTFKNEWDKIQATTQDGKILRETGGRPNNLTTYEPHRLLETTAKAAPKITSGE
jgi:hypothetical protein